MKDNAIKPIERLMENLKKESVKLHDNTVNEPCCYNLKIPKVILNILVTSTILRRK